MTDDKYWRDLMAALREDAKKLEALSKVVDADTLDIPEFLKRKKEPKK